MNRTPPTALKDALAQLRTTLLSGRAATAEKMARALLERLPGEVNSLWMLGVAQLDQDRAGEGLQALTEATRRAPDFVEARIDLARAYRATGQAQEARTHVRRVLESQPHHHRAWLAYGDILVDLGQPDDARVAFERARVTQPAAAQIEAASAALVADDRRRAEELFRAILVRDPAHTGALCGLAAVSLAADRPRDAERLLRHALRQSPHLPLAWRGLAPALTQLGRLGEAQAATEYLARIEPQSPQTWITGAAVATRLMKQERALEAYERAAALQPQEVGLRMSIGHVLKTLGRRHESEAAYRQALAMDPGRGEAYWSLADLKNYTFTDAEVEAMRALLERDPRTGNNQSQLHFALGKACEQRADYARAFEHYAQGNALRRLEAPFDSDAFERRAARIRAFFDEAFFRGHAGQGAPDPAPIFIVGLPRSGSTLIEQILASHSSVEGTMELPNILNFVGYLDDFSPGRDAYPESIARLAPGELGALGRAYLDETAPLRTGRPHFTDKLPNNFSHVGLIHAILPRATIIDARRHPMDACLSAFKQHFAEGQTFSYDLTDLGRYYRTYLSLMDHWDRVLPGKVLHVQYEALVREPEAQIRRLLAHCGLPFESACLNFHETRRPVRTASAEQVRQPLYRSGLGYWHHFEAQLAPLKAALGDALDRFQNGSA